MDISTDICPKHAQSYVALDSKGNQICNQCLYYLSDEKITFNATASKEIKQKYDEAMKLYEEQMKKINQVSPSIITTSVTENLNNFFSSLHQEVNSIESRIMTEI